ncbi:MAG TPA: UDP-galactopyranose mutase [Verrucomicrobiales bacterium]|nr:MAG: UDP-galactopyranose mutase [Verrucomicrobiae bacterium Tous-C3TDCM]PAZ06830.1 MAG: UDP-galactopyranose mutase [Verrucomicrobiae bacterium AMD-G2]HBE23010.1 UDP-galactopyranose mutase [Verrucomicrobiales bacterium]
MTHKNILIVGAGFSGATAARCLVEKFPHIRVTVLDKRSHTAGNCHTSRDPVTGVMLHVYGPHVFHTDRQDVWNFVNRFAVFRPFILRTKTTTRGEAFGLPINLHTINQFFRKNFTPQEARDFIATKADKSIIEAQNFEEQALKFIGPELYYAFFRGYTMKQWGCDPKMLPASILKRLPLRFDYNDNYFNDPYQGIPEQGYTAMVENLLDDSRICVKLNTEYVRDMSAAYDMTIYTGEIDRFFAYDEGRLRYRTVFWKTEKAIASQTECKTSTITTSPDLKVYDLQGTAVMNFPDPDVPFTRKIEHKHFAPWETHAGSVLYTEFSKETEADDTPYYPKRLSSDLLLLTKYQKRASELPNIHFLGRLATYRYMDMHQVIGEALDFVHVQ